MTLKEKFEQVKSPIAIELEKIADDYAIEFAEWIKNSSIKNTDLPISVLLKMFKNQKGL